MSDAKKGWLTIFTLAALAGCMFLVANRFARYEQAAYAQSHLPIPRIGAVRPGDGDATALPDVSVAADLDLPESIVEGHATGLDPHSLNDESVHLLDPVGQRVPARLNTSGAGDAIVLVPIKPLEEGRRYTFEVTPELRDLDGRAFARHLSSFVVAKDVARETIDVAFEQVPLNVDSGTAFTAITMGPDQKLYAGTFDGRIIRYTIQSDGTLTDAQTIDTIQKNNSSPRMVIGFAFDPNSKSKLWVSHGQLKAFEGGSITGADDWTGAISILQGTNLDNYHDAVIHLPRGYKDHLNFQPVFGPDGALYFNQGSHTSSGAPDSKWGMRSEHPLTAAILRLDPQRLGDRTLDGQTEGAAAYDPYAPNAPLTIYATGVRSSYDLLWHSSRKLFASVNGYAAGGNAPGRARSGRSGAIAPIERLSQTSDDVLIQVEPGGYYGHPNPTRNQFIINGGNPTALSDPYEVVEYPVGTMPESNWQMPVMSFGKNVSPNGMIEYLSDAFEGKLKHHILVTRFSSGDDIVAIEMDEHGSPRSLISGIRGFGGLTDPLDLACDANSGRIYVAEFGGQRLTLLRPIVGSSQVHRRKLR